MTDVTNTKKRVAKTEIGIVTSAKMNKTIVVEVVRFTKHPKYDKYLKRNTRFYAHDENKQAVVGDKVEIASTRPLSKLKRHRLLRVLKHEEV